MCQKFDHKVETCNDWILCVFLGSLYGRITVHESWKCVKNELYLEVRKAAIFTFSA